MRRKSNPLTNQVAKDALRKLEAVEIAHSGAHPKYAIYDARGNVLATTLCRLFLILPVAPKTKTIG
jgi:hypothetical protein